MILPSDETDLSTKGKPDEEDSLSTKESFTGKIGVTIGDLDKYKKDSLINIWKDANAYYSSGEEWTDEDAEFFDELAVRINTATEEGIGTVSGPAVGMVANKEFDYKNNEDEKAIKDEGLNGDDGLGFGQHNESFNEDDHPRDESGQFTSGSGSNSGSSDSEPESDEWSGNPDTNPFKDKNIKDIIKSIKGGSKNWQDWKFDEHIPEMAEIEKRNKEIPRPEKPEGYTNEKIFRDDPNAIQKMEAKIKYLENVADYWKQVTKFPVRDFGNKLGYSSLGDQKWYAMSNNSQLLNGTRKKLEQIKNQGTLTRNTTYKSDQYGKSKPRFYYKEEPKGESLDQILLNENYIQDQFGVFYRPVYVGENYKEHKSDLVFEGKLYTNEGVGNCPFCKGAGKITVEKLGLKDCPDCDGTGDIQGEQQIPQQIPQEVPVEEEKKPNPFAKGGESKASETVPTWEEMDQVGGLSEPDSHIAIAISKGHGFDYAEQKRIFRELENIASKYNTTYDTYSGDWDTLHNGMRVKMHLSDQAVSDIENINPMLIRASVSESKANEEGTSDGAKKGWDTRGRGGSSDEDKVDNLERYHSDFMQRKGFVSGKQIEGVWEEYKSEMIPLIQQQGEITGNLAYMLEDENNHNLVRLLKDEFGVRPSSESKASEGDSDYCKICGDFDESHYNEDGSIRDHEFKAGGVSSESLNTVCPECGSKNTSRQKTKFGGGQAPERFDCKKCGNVFKPKSTESCGCKTKGLEANISKYEKFVKTEINVLKTRAKAGEAVGLMYGLPTVRKNGKKIKGTLAYAGVSLNDRIYLPEELAKGHGKTLPLLLNHSSTAGAEEEMDRLDGEMRDHLENEKDYEVGEVTLTWDADKLTLFYEGVIENEFFQKEVDDMDMAVSLGIFYDSNSPKVCDEECYTLIKGAEFREVSLVYHAGFPIATIEAVESKLKRASIKDIKAKASEVNYDYNNIEGGSTIQYYGYDSRTGNADGSIKKGKAQLKGPAGWVVGSGNGTIVDERSFISSESKANEDSLIKIEDNEDADTQVTILDEWKNETDPDVNGETKGIRTTKAKEYYLGDKIKMTDDAIDNYGQQYKDKSFTISHIANSVEDHMGYDEGMGGENLYDLDELEFSLYDYEVESASESKASEELDEEEDEMPLGGSVNAEPKETDTVEQPIIVESVQTPNSFSVRGVSGMTISNSNGVEKYAFDPTQNYSTNTIHFSVTEQGGTIFGEEIQLTPKMTTPDELTKEIESKPDIKFTDADEDILKKN
jgi:hypothetical protein